MVMPDDSDAAFKSQPETTPRSDCSTLASSGVGYGYNALPEAFKTPGEQTVQSIGCQLPCHWGKQLHSCTVCLKQELLLEIADDERASQESLAQDLLHNGLQLSFSWGSKCDCSKCLGQALLLELGQA